jgi:hypothetical protein
MKLEKPNPENDFSSFFLLDFLRENYFLSFVEENG